MADESAFHHPHAPRHDLREARGVEVSKTGGAQPVKPAPAQRPQWEFTTTGGHPGLRPAEGK